MNKDLNSDSGRICAAAGPAALVNEMQQAFAKALESLAKRWERRAADLRPLCTAKYHFNEVALWESAAKELRAEMEKLSRLATTGVVE